MSSFIEFFETKTSQCRGHWAGMEKSPASCACKTEHRFRILAGNGEILAQSEGYTSKQNAEKGALAASERIIKGFLAAELKQITPMLRNYPDLLPVCQYLASRIETLERQGVQIMPPRVNSELDQFLAKFREEGQ